MEFVNKTIDFGKYCKQFEVCEECLKTRANERSKKTKTGKMDSVVAMTDAYIVYKRYANNFF